jgi:hypothetical protein
MDGITRHRRRCQRPVHGRQGDSGERTKQQSVGRNLKAEFEHFLHRHCQQSDGRPSPNPVATRLTACRVQIAPNGASQQGDQQGEHFFLFPERGYWEPLVAWDNESVRRATDVNHNLIREAHRFATDALDAIFPVLIQPSKEWCTAPPQENSAPRCIPRAGTGRSKS